MCNHAFFGSWLPIIKLVWNLPRVLTSSCLGENAAKITVNRWILCLITRKKFAFWNYELKTNDTRQKNLLITFKGISLLEKPQFIRSSFFHTFAVKTDSEFIKYSESHTLSTYWVSDFCLCPYILYTNCNFFCVFPSKQDGVQNQEKVYSGQDGRATIIQVLKHTLIFSNMFM